MIFSAPGEIVGGLTNFALSCANSIVCARDRQHRFMELTHRLVDILLASLIAVRQLGKLGGEITVRQTHARNPHPFHHFTHAHIRLLLRSAGLTTLAGYPTPV